MSKVETARDANGDVRVAHKLSQEQFETLKLLHKSGAWGEYRQLLIQTKDAYVNSMLQMKDPNEMIKSIGFIGGLNYAINNVAVLCAEYDRVEKEKLEKAEKKPEPLMRG